MSTKRSKAAPALILFLAAACLALSGCGRSPSEATADKMAEKAIEKQTGGKAKVNASEGKMEIKTAKGEEIHLDEKGGAKLPEGFPKDVYIYAGAAVKQSMKMENTFHVVMDTPDAKSKVVDTYKSKLEGEGWKQNTSVDTGDATMLQYQKEKRSVILNVSESDGKTQAMLTVSEEK